MTIVFCPIPIWIHNKTKGIARFFFLENFRGCPYVVRKESPPYVFLDFGLFRSYLAVSLAGR